MDVSRDKKSLEWFNLALYTPRLLDISTSVLLYAEKTCY